MTLTEVSPPATASAPSADPAWLHHLITTSDHKVVGRLYMGFSTVLLVLVATVGAVVGIEGMNLDDLALFDTFDALAQASSLYQFGLVFLVVVPFFTGLALAVTPMQVGSPAVAFPRAAAASFWMWLVGAGIVIASWAADGGLGGSVEGTNSDSVALSVAGLITVIVALGLGLVCVATTVVALRCAGMSLHRVPLLSWTSLVWSSLLLLSLPILAGDLLVAYVDLRGRAPIAFGIEDAIYGEVSWAVSAPQVFLYVLPVLGVIGEIVPVAARTRQKLYEILLGAAALFGVLGFGGFARVAFETPGQQPSTDEFLYYVVGVAIIVPVLMSLGGWADSLRQGGRRLRPSAPLVTGGLTILALLAAAVASVVRAVVPFELVGTSADGAVADLALWTGVAGSVAALAFWGPKLSGRVAAPILGQGVALLVLVGVMVTAVPMLAAGFIDDPMDNADLLDALRLISGLGTIVLAAAALVALLSFLLVTLGRGVPAPDDPWGGHTLEWSTTSPPPAGNFAVAVGPVRSERPLLDREEGDR